MRQAVIAAGRDDEVLANLDDLSCGPIDSEDPSVRERWWAQFYNSRNPHGTLSAFWERVLASDDRLVVWFGRHAALELSFFLAWTERLGDRPYNVIDVTGLRYPVIRRDGSSGTSRPTPCVSIVNPDPLKSLIGSERSLTTRETEESRLRWRRLKAENAPFRIVTGDGLASTPVEYFDPWLLERATSEWRRTLEMIAETMGYQSEPYIQVGDVMLLSRVVALVAEGKLLADGDPRDMYECRVRLP